MLAGKPTKGKHLFFLGFVMFWSISSVLTQRHRIQSNANAE